MQSVSQSQLKSHAERDGRCCSCRQAVTNDCRTSSAKHRCIRLHKCSERQLDLQSRRERQCEIGLIVWPIQRDSSIRFLIRIVSGWSQLSAWGFGDIGIGLVGMLRGKMCRGSVKTCCKDLSQLSAIATVEATEAAASVKILTGAIIITVIKITIVTFNANSTIW